VCGASVWEHIVMVGLLIRAKTLGKLNDLAYLTAGKRFPSRGGAGRAHPSETARTTIGTPELPEPPRQCRCPHAPSERDRGGHL